MEFKVTSAQGDTIVKANITANNQQFKFPYTKTPNGIVVDPNNWVLNNTGSITNGGTIPAKLLSFDVAAGNNCTASLQWKTSNEQNSKQYELEYSTDGINYITAGTVASNNSSSESLYQYSYPLTASAEHYFRLKMVDKDGGFIYSQVITLNKKCMGIFSVAIAPNPVKEKLYLVVTLPSPGSTTIKIFDAKGALVYKDVKMFTAGENLFQLDIIQKFAPGTYMLRTESQYGTGSNKFVKL